MEWVNYGYKHLSMIFSNSPDIFQQKMIDFLQEFWFIRAYRKHFEYEKKWLEISRKKLDLIICKLEETKAGTGVV